MSEKKTTIIFMANDDRTKGGFCDRMRAIIWLYSFCKKHNFDFRINFTNPFNLQDYLKPNSYDWIYNEKEINTVHNTVILSVFDKMLKEYYANSTVFCEHSSTNESEMEILRHADKYAKIFVYSNIGVREIIPVYGELFNELFCFSEPLSEKLQYHIKRMDSRYVAAHFRFRVLLNDSNTEIPSDVAALPVLKANKQKELIRVCMKEIEKIHKMNPGYKVLVCSDSMNFINSVKALNYVYIIDGYRRHIDTGGFFDSEQVYLLMSDYFLCVSAKKIYSIIKKGMYPSTFPKYASYHNKIPCIIYDDRIPIWKRYLMLVIKKYGKNSQGILKKNYFYNPESITRQHGLTEQARTVFAMLKDTENLEVKQGFYAGENDKTRFDRIYNKNTME